MSVVKVIGVPSSAGCRAETSSVIDQHNGPQAIRSAYKALTGNFSIPTNFIDGGDIANVDTVSNLLTSVERAVEQVAAEGEIPLLLGGVHTLTLGALRGIQKYVSDFSVIYIDAHADLMPHPQINYGSLLFYAIKEEVVHADRLALFGIRQVEDPEYALMKENKIFHLHSSEFEEYGIRSVVSQIRDRFEPPYYISVDLDSIDPAFAPGVTCPYPGGLSGREVGFLLEELCSSSEVVGIDIVEHAPLNDINDMTAKLAAHFMLSASRSIASRVKRH